MSSQRSIWKIVVRQGLLSLLVVAVLFLCLAGLLQLRWQLRWGADVLDQGEQVQLRALGKEALRSNDVPVSALLKYGTETIGEGFNTVARDGNAGGHAEINAISDAIHRAGFTQFMALDRDSLRLVSTYEPCPMCRGALLEYRITHVEFLKGKSFWYHVKEGFRLFGYRWRMEAVEPAALQDSLFVMHPAHRRVD